MNKKIIRLIAVLTLVTVFAVGCSGGSGGASKALAKVDGDTISLEDVDYIRAAYQEKIENYKKEVEEGTREFSEEDIKSIVSQYEQAFKKAVNNLVDLKLISKNIGEFEVSEEEVNTQIEAYLEEMQAKFSETPEKFDEYLAHVMDEEGNYKDEIKEIAKKNAIIERAGEELAKDASYSDDDIFYHFARNREYIVSAAYQAVNIGDEDEANAIREGIQTVEDFEKLYNETTDFTTEEGADKVVKLEGEIKKFVLGAPVDKISDVLERTIDGEDVYTIARVLDKNDNFDELTDEIKDHMKTDLVEEKLLDLKSKVDLEVMDYEIPGLDIDLKK